MIFMVDRRTRSIAIAAALAAALLPAAARAIPGTTIAQFTAWAKANPALHGLSKQLTNQMTAQPYFTATFHAGSVAGTFLANAGDNNVISDESVAVDTQNESYDILKHPDVAFAMVATVYGSGVANDFKSAPKVGVWKLYGQTHATALYRGKLYGYEASLFAVQLIAHSRIDSEAKRLAGCVKTDCNDD